jgi:hypothetical protein
MNYWICYDIGYGEKGVKEENLSQEQVYNYLKNNYSLKIAELWIKNISDYYYLTNDDFIINEISFEEEDWISNGEGT